MAATEPTETQPRWHLATYITSAKCVSYKAQITDNGVVSAAPAIVTMTSSGFIRVDSPGGSVTIRDRTAGRVSVFDPVDKSWLIEESTPIDSVISTERVIDQFNWIQDFSLGNGSFEGWDSLYGEPNEVWALQRNRRDRYVTEIRVWVSRGRRTVERVEFREEPNLRRTLPSVTLWVGDLCAQDDSVTITPAGKKGRSVVATRFDFEWKGSIDTTMFSIDSVPHKKANRIIAATPEADVVTSEFRNALADWAQHSSGKFPAKLEDMTDPEKVRGYLLRKYIHDVPLEDVDQIIGDIQSLLQATTVVEDLKEHYQMFHYMGGEALLGDADLPLCSWGPIDGGYIVLYADLHSQLVQ